jgi:hypothetical protein
MCRCRLQATSYAIQQERETLDQEPFDCAAGPDKPMMELQAGSRVYYQASIIRESRTEIRVLFPGAQTGARGCPSRFDVQAALRPAF